MAEHRTMAGVPPGADGRAADELFGVVYAELRRAAERHLALEPAGHTLQPTALVHEAYLRLIGDDGERWGDPAYFFGAASRAMRRILVEHARRKGRPKRGGGRVRLPLDSVGGAAAEGADWVMLDDLLSALAAEDERAGRVVELRVFGGLELPETARLLGVSEATVKRDWVYARAWLRERVAEDERDEP